MRLALLVLVGLLLAVLGGASVDARGDGCCPCEAEAAPHEGHEASADCCRPGPGQCVCVVPLQAAIPRPVTVEPRRPSVAPTSSVLAARGLHARPRPPPPTPPPIG